METARNVVRHTERALREASYSNLNWRIELKTAIATQAKAYPWNSSVRFVEIPREDVAFHLDLHTDRFFTARPNKDDPPPGSGRKFPRVESERPASLVVSIHPNGSIIFMISGHRSDYANTAYGNFIVGYFEKSWELSGQIGQRRIKRILSLFESLSLYTLTERCPDARSGRFLKKLESRSERYRSVYENSAVARRERISREAALAAGLTGGLISSTVFPLLAVLGKESSEKASAIASMCKDAKGLISQCFEANNYRFFDVAGTLLSTPSVLVISLVLTVVALWAIARYARLQ